MSRPLADPVFDIGRDLQRAYEEGYKQGRYDEMVEIEMSLPKWIPVSERLPEKSKQVMCCDKQGRVFTSAMTYINSNGEPSFGKHYGVLAWMPLPEPYDCGAKMGGDDE